MKKPAIPSANVPDRQLASLLQPIKQNIEQITGVRGGPLDTVQSNATLADVITALNSVIERLNA